MKYNPDKHHRCSIRLKGHDYSSPGAYFITICTHQRQCLFGEIVDGEMRLNALGQLVNVCWQRLPSHFSNLTLDAFVIMPNHVHGILVLTDRTCRGAALGDDTENPVENVVPNATPNPPSKQDAALRQKLCSEEGVASGQRQSSLVGDGLPNAAPLQAHLVEGSVGAIVLNFKSVITRSRNRMQRLTGSPMWQRNYYDHIIRDEKSLQLIRQYICNNPLSWQEDQLHPDVPSKW